MVTLSPAASVTITSPSVPPMMILPAATEVTTPETILFAALPVKPLTLTDFPAVNPAVTNPFPESLKELSAESAEIVVAVFVTDAESCDNSTSSFPVNVAAVASWLILVAM